MLRTPDPSKEKDWKIQQVNWKEKKKNWSLGTSMTIVLNIVSGFCPDGNGNWRAETPERSCTNSGGWITQKASGWPEGFFFSLSPFLSVMIHFNWLLRTFCTSGLKPSWITASASQEVPVIHWCTIITKTRARMWESKKLNIKTVDEAILYCSFYPYAWNSQTWAPPRTAGRRSQ